MNGKLTYSQVGDDYDNIKDPVKKLAQKFAKSTTINLTRKGFKEISETRGESAYVWQQGDTYMAFAVEGLGTKNLIADKIDAGEKYYQSIAHDTVATIINDLVSVGASPLVLNAYWAIPNNKWLENKKRINSLILGWKKACDTAGVSWGGGETATLNGIIKNGTVDLGGAAVGIIKNRKRLLIDTNLKTGDRIVLLKSNGINSNGISLVRALEKRLPKGYSTKLKNGNLFGDEALRKSNIYAKLINRILDSGIRLHYISNITGHGLRKIMRSERNFTYVIEEIIEPPGICNFIQKKLRLSDYEMYQTFNMGMDYALFVDKKDVDRTLGVVKKEGFSGINAGYIKIGKRQILIKPKNIAYGGKTLDLR
ncbi:AIR synthase related protein [Patescibacteria group bacterium]|nr:AIR synthase related protein [Patescibacteria group bacterium]